MDFQNLTTLEYIYWSSAIIGGALFIFRTIMLFAGGDLFGSDMDLDFDGDIDIADMDIDLDSDVHPDSDVSFKFLSMQGITAFLMMFGLVGLALFNTILHPFISIIGATVAGYLTTLVIGFVFAAMSRLQSDGTTNIQNAKGQIGEVYLSIPNNGTGQVRVVVQGNLRIFDAVSEDKKKIATGTSIEVIGIKGNTLIVKKEG